MNAAGTVDLLTNTGDFVGDLMDLTKGGLSIENGVNIFAGPDNAGTNPRTGTAWDPSQSVFRRTWALVSSEINLLGIWLPAMQMNIQFDDARPCTTPGDPVSPW